MAQTFYTLEPLLGISYTAEEVAECVKTAKEHQDMLTTAARKAIYDWQSAQFYRMLFGEEKKMKAYVVIATDSRDSTHWPILEHGSLWQAEQKAAELARNHPGQKFYVLQRIKSVVCEAPPLKWEACPPDPSVP